MPDSIIIIWIGYIVFNDMELSYTACSIALSIILFDGGIHTPLRSFRSAARPAVLLATLGVAITAAITGVGMWSVFADDPLKALLFGSIVASTDAAAVFLLLRQRNIELNPSLTNTLKVESGVNDPMAIFLTLTFVELLTAGGAEISGPFIAAQFFRQMGIGAAFGFAGGRLLRWIFDRIELNSGLCSILALASGLLIFGATNMLGGSGFLAVYIAGLVLGHHQYKAKKLVQQFMDGMAWLAQLAMLLVLGLLVTPSELSGDIPRAVAVAFILIFVARPVAVFISLAFETFSLKEKLFVSWVGLRGGIPIYLAIIPVRLGLEGNYFNIAFIVVLCSLFIQGWTIQAVARRLGVKKDNNA